MSPSIRAAAYPAILLALAACRDSAAEDGAWRGRVETLPNGVELVSNPDVGMWGSDGSWRLVEVLRLGSMESDGPELFGSVDGLQLDEGGRIYVLDAQAKEVRIFDADGRHIRSFGGQGGGPGEFEAPSALLWGPDGNLWVVDQRNARFSVFDTAGVYLTSHPRPGGIMIMPWPGGFDRQGNLHDIAVGGREPPTFGLTRLDTALQPTDTFTLPPFQAETFAIRSANNVMMTSVPFAPSQVWELGPEGEVWIGITNRYRLHRVNYAGDTVRIVEREFEPAEVTEEDRERGMERLERFIQQGGTVDESRIPSTKPAFRDVEVDPEGYLWVRPTAAAEEEDHLFDIFDPDGRYLGRLRSRFPVRPGAPLVVRGSEMLAVTQDELGVSYVVRARIDGRQGHG